MIARVAEAVARGTMRFFSHAIVVMLTMLASAASLTWAIISPSELSWTLFLSILAIAMQSGDLFLTKCKPDSPLNDA